MTDFFNGKRNLGDKSSKKPRTFKTKRAQTKHIETLKEIAAQLKSTASMERGMKQ